MNYGQARPMKRLPIPDATTLDSTLEFLITETRRVDKLIAKEKNGVRNHGRTSSKTRPILYAAGVLAHYYGKDMQLHQITSEVLQKLVDDELARGTSLGAVVRMQFTIRQRMLMYGVTLKYPNHPKYNTQAKPGILSKELYRQIIQDPNLRGNLRRWFVVAVNTGLRGNEIGLLRKDAIDFDDNFLYIDPDISKNERRRRVPIPPDAMQVFREVFLGRPSEGHTTFGELTCKYGIKDQWFAYRNASALPIQKINWHKLRHTWISWMLSDGLPLYEVMRWAGHKKPETTINYAHSLGENDERMREVFKSR